MDDQSQGLLEGVAHRVGLTLTASVLVASARVNDPIGDRAAQIEVEFGAAGMEPVRLEAIAHLILRNIVMGLEEDGCSCDVCDARMTRAAAALEALRDISVDRKSHN